MKAIGSSPVLAVLLGALWVPGSTAPAGELIPPAAQMKKDRPRLLLRPGETPHAISLRQLKAVPRGAESAQLLGQLRGHKNAAAQALVYLLTGEKGAAEKAIAGMRAWKSPEGSNPFDVYFRLREMALAYDWLHGYPGFTAEIKAGVRAEAGKLAAAGLRHGDDHVFHNYVWMFNSGAMLWALATAGEDAGSDRLFEALRGRFNGRLFRAMEYLAGQPADAQGYWSLYCLSPGVTVLMSAQSAFEADLAGRVRKDGGDWLNAQLQNLVHTTLPDLRYVPWGDMQGGGDGGVAHEMAGSIDMMTWATKSPTGVRLGRWLAEARGAKRFYGETAVFHFLYSRNLKTAPAEPPLAHLSGGRHGGHFIAREKWEDGATVVGFRCTDHYTGHNHHDQGSFVVYRKGLLALDAGFYKRPRGQQQKTENHNTLLFGGAGQRRVRARANSTLESYKRALGPGPGSFETGNVLFHKNTPGWAAVAGEFGQAYDPSVVGKAVRQMLYVRPGTVAVIDHLAGPGGRALPEVSWLLHVPAEPETGDGSLSAANGTAWLRCRSLLPGKASLEVKAGAQTQVTAGKKSRIATWQAAYKYPGEPAMTLVHLLEVGDGATPGKGPVARAKLSAGGVELVLGGKTFLFSAKGSCEISEKQQGGPH